jgi:hypothetical protein
MRYAYRVAMLLFAMSLAPVVWSDGYCPPGMYAIHSPGVIGCAPIPGATAPPPERAVDYWGALATDMAGSGINGVAADLSSRRAANRAAIESCRAGGGRKCKVVATYVNSCIVVATPVRDGVRAAGRFTYQLGPQPERLKAPAIRLCMELNGLGCEIGYQQCSVPIL